MSGRLRIGTAIAVNTLLARFVAADDRFTLDLETAAARQLRNDFAVPGDTGTLARLGDWGPSFSGRATLNRNVNDRSSVRFPAAPRSADSDHIAMKHATST